MHFQTKQDKTVSLLFFTIDQTAALSNYWGKLSVTTKQRFAPHAFDEASILELFKEPSQHIGFTATEAGTNNIIAYSVIQIGCIQHDAERIKAYGLKLSNITDASFAPSVADAWQSSGLGSAMFLFIKSSLRQFGIKRLFLWGGVQAGNEKAVKFYLKHNFSKLGLFEYNGSNWDMFSDL